MFNLKIYIFLYFQNNTFEILFKTVYTGSSANMKIALCFTTITLFLKCFFLKSICFVTFFLSNESKYAHSNCEIKNK